MPQITDRALIACHVDGTAGIIHCSGINIEHDLNIELPPGLATPSAGVWVWEGCCIGVGADCQLQTLSWRQPNVQEWAAVMLHESPWPSLVSRGIKLVAAEPVCPVAVADQTAWNKVAGVIDGNKQA